jgi:hypothetical protein
MVKICVLLFNFMSVAFMLRVGMVGEAKTVSDIICRICLITLYFTTLGVLAMRSEDEDN